MLIKYLVIIFSLLSFISCDDTKTNGTPPVSRNKVYLKVTNNSASDISYQRDTIRCEQGLDYNASQFEEWSPVCEIIENDYSQIYLGEKYWGTNTPPISSAILMPSKSATSYGELGRTTQLSHSTFVDFMSFIITVTIDNVSKKIVGFDEELYRKLFHDKPPEFFDDVISYGSFFSATLDRVIPTDFKSNPCWVGTHTALTDYSNFSINARYYFDITVKSINDITVSLDKPKSKIGDSGHLKDTNECKFYVDEDTLAKEEGQISIFPITEKDYANIPKDLTGRVYMITDPDKSYGVLRYGSDPE